MMQALMMQALEPEARTAPGKIAKFVAAGKNPDRGRLPLVADPKSGRGQLQEMPVRIAEIDAVAATRPCGAALDGDAGAAQPLFPGRQLVGRNGERHMGRPLAVMGRDGAARQL